MQNPHREFFVWVRCLLALFLGDALIYASYFGDSGRTSYNCSSPNVWLPRDPPQFPACAPLRPAWPVSIPEVILNKYKHCNQPNKEMSSNWFPGPIWKKNITTHSLQLHGWCPVQCVNWNTCFGVQGPSLSFAILGAGRLGRKLWKICLGFRYLS